jgi:two-component system chemotaxis response regulator CheY
MAQILVVDDSATVRTIIVHFLTENGFTSQQAVDGVDGLAKLKADPSIKLVLCDVNMPMMDGLTMVEKIRNELKNTTVNVLVSTTVIDPALKNRARAAGVKGWMTKPFNGTAVLSTIKSLVK